ncbi:hypothetical protein HMN09_01329700 [Mycena chlorophos]|uniref:Uncharacterized protein n=1 Tax=Mycena chlorophos TaxID=658473 RepID=A0A8H6RZ58_MYCCL|nr:hypothetical protein HMN09_01329700 [Mycena chlorophos]
MEPHPSTPQSEVRVHNAAAALPSTTTSPSPETPPLEFIFNDGHGTLVRLPATPSGAAQLLHLTQTHYQTHVFAHRAIKDRIHQQNLYLNGLHGQLDAVGKSIVTAEKDIMRAKTMLAVQGLPLVEDDCERCADLMGVRVL